MILKDLLTLSETKLKVEKPIKSDKDKVEPMKFKKFSDTEQGIKEFMKDKGEVTQGFTRKLDLATCKFMADPSVEGVWAIDSMKMGIRVIVYLGGYKDPWGRVRDGNDFEEGGIPKRSLDSYLAIGKITQDQYDKFSK